MSIWPTQIMVYAGGDAASRFPGLQQDLWRQLGLLQQIVTNRVVSAVFQLDGTTAASVRGLLDPARRIPFESLGETNTGDPNELIDFISWARQNYPSERSILVLSGHGLAWQDARAESNLRRGLVGLAAIPQNGLKSHDVIRHPKKLFRPIPKSDNLSHALELETRALMMDGNTRNGTEDYLSNSELGAALAQATVQNSRRKFDTVVFDACLMSSVEILCELRDATSTVVGAVDEISAAGMNIAGAAQRITQGGGSLNSRAMAAAFSETYSPAASSDSCIATDVGGEGFSAGLNWFRSTTEELLQWLRVNPGRIDEIRRGLQHAASLVRFNNQSVSDLGALPATLQDVMDIPLSIRQKLGRAIESFNSSILGRATGGDYRTALGISCFVPASQVEYIFNRSDYTRLRFNAITGWSGVLDLIFRNDAGANFEPILM